MKRITFYIFILFTGIYSIIPFKLLYLFSYKLYILLFYIIGYRKKVVKKNIERSFPNLAQAEQAKIVKGFYHNLCDILLEGVKGFTINKKALQKRYVFVNPEVLNDFYDKGQNVVAVGSHYANWEWGIMAAPLLLKHKLYAFYTPLTNKLIDAHIRKNRRKWGTELVPSRDTRKVFNKEHDKPAMFFFGADQSPSKPRGAHWMKFLNQDTACLKGPEFFAKHYELPVVYLDVQRVKKGHYTVRLEVLEYNSEKTAEGDITEKYMHKLERIVNNKPEDFLWSHKRWKHSREK